jgi:hypothetical protein
MGWAETRWCVRDLYEQPAGPRTPVEGRPARSVRAGHIDVAKRQLCVRQSDWNRQVTSPKSGRLRYVPLTRRVHASQSRSARRGDSAAGWCSSSTVPWRHFGDGLGDVKTINKTGQETGGEAGIRTLGRSLSPYNGLANRRLQPLGHLTAAGFPKYTSALRLRGSRSRPHCP